MSRPATGQASAVIAALLASVALLWPHAAPAAGFAPSAGGAYKGKIYNGQSKAALGSLTLLVANDGGSLEGGYVELDAPCRPSSSLIVQDWPSSLTPVSETGAFAWSGPKYSPRDSLEVSGQFSRDGRAVEGRMSFVDEGNDCVARDLTFRALLTGRPARTRPGRPTSCAPVPAREGEIVAHERDVGCTQAKALTGAWAHRRDCRRSPSSPGCAVKGFRCTGLHGGRFSAQAIVRCRAAHALAGTVEFDMQRNCGYVHSARVNVSGLNISCATARSIVRQIPEGCNDGHGDRCDAGSYRCHNTEFTPDSILGRCVSRRDPFRALLFEYVLPL